MVRGDQKLGREIVVKDRELDTQLIEALLAGDEKAFGIVVTRYNRAMVRLAMAYVPTRAIAEEVAQEAWLAVVKGLAGFRGQSSLKTWLFGILLNRAKSKGSREKRNVPFSALETKTTSGEQASDEWVIDRMANSERWVVAQGWSSRSSSPEDQVLSAELGFCLERAIGMLPPTQRIVVVLRDVEGWSSGAICALLGITPANPRVRLHRARLRLRSAVEAYLNRV